MTCLTRVLGSHTTKPILAIAIMCLLRWLATLDSNQVAMTHGVSLHAVGQARETNISVPYTANATAAPTTLAPPTFTVPAPSAENRTWNQTRFFDVFLYTHEIEMLELRLAELYNVTEKFIVVEVLMTFTGRTREESFMREVEQIPRHLVDKIYFHQCKTLSGGGVWDREASARLCSFHAMQAAGVGAYDLVHTADADEFPSAVGVQTYIDETTAIVNDPKYVADRDAMVAHLRTMYPMKFHVQFHLYNFLTLADYKWTTSLYFIFSKEYFTNANIMRHRDGGWQRTSELAGWHCSWCFKSVSEYENKFRSYSHTEFFDERNFAPEHVKKCTCNGEWIFKYSSRGGFYPPKRRMEPEEALKLMPSYLAKNYKQPRFRYLFPDASNCELPNTTTLLLKVQAN